MKNIYDEENKIVLEISNDIDVNIENLNSIFENCDDMVFKEFRLSRENEILRIYIIYTDGLTDGNMIENTIIHPLQWEWRDSKLTKLPQQLFLSQIETTDVKEETNLDNTINSVLRGDTAVFIDGVDKVFIVSSKKLPQRGIDEASKEVVVRGPRDNFNESLRSSTALIRRRIKDAKLKVKQLKIGERTRTDCALMYMEDLARPELIKDVQDKLNEYEIDGILDSGMIEHLIEKKWYTPFPQIQSTVRPDKAASAIMEGRVVLVVDNSPEVLIVPATLNTFFQASDDYYNRWPVATFARILRYIAAIMAIGLPGFYIAITTFHTEVIPTELLLAIKEARSAVTLPVVLEVLLMELEFELLREAGIRLPGSMGNTIGVVGGLIVGQAAVDAGLVSTIVVIVVALTAIATFAIPSEEFVSVFRLLKFFVIAACAFFGLYGFLVAMLFVAVSLANLESFGIPYMMPAVSGANVKYDDKKDNILRLPLLCMLRL